MVGERTGTNKVYELGARYQLTVLRLNKNGNFEMSRVH